MNFLYRSVFQMKKIIISQILLLSWERSRAQTKHIAAPTYLALLFVQPVVACTGDPMPGGECVQGACSACCNELSAYPNVRRVLRRNNGCARPREKRGLWNASASTPCRTGKYIGPMAHLVQHLALTVVNQMPVGSLQAGHEHHSTRPTCDSQQLVIRGRMLAEHQNAWISQCAQISPPVQ